MEGSILLSRVHETMHITIHPQKSVTITVNRLSLHMFEDEFINFSRMILASQEYIERNDITTLAAFDKGRVIRTVSGMLNVSFLSIAFNFCDEGYESFISLITRAIENYDEHFRENTIDEDILLFLEEIEKAG